MRLLPGLPGALLTRARTSYAQPAQKFSFWSQCCGLTGSCGSYDRETCVSNNPSGDFEMMRCITHSRVVEGTRHTWGDTGRS